MLDVVLLSDKPAAASSSNPAAPPPAATAATMAGAAGPPAKDVGGADKCPVDHKTRDAWLAQARAANSEQTPDPHGAAARPGAPAQTTAQKAPAETPSGGGGGGGGWGWRIPFFSGASSQHDGISNPSPATAGSSGAAVRAQPATTSLSTDRVISSIPRTADPGPSSCPAPVHQQQQQQQPPPGAGSSSAVPANAESTTTSDAASGRWIYPSEKMFFDAMRRKGHTGANPTDMRSIVPIHNAVNERAWAEIRAWEAPYCAPAASPSGAPHTSGKCASGPRLHSFSGDSTKMSPKARVNTLLGYTAPFDRHDWVVDRCGTRVEYVIDFYSGRPDPSGKGPVSFYLDVRPKLNSWEGVKMRFLRGVGAV